MNPQRRLLFGVYAIIAIVIVGAGGYVSIEGWSFLDALYMTVITITTVGYAEVHPLSAGGKIFSIFLIVGGAGGALYALSGIVGYVIEGQFRTTLGRRRMEARIEKLKGHFIVCGYGRVSREIARTFKAEGVPFVIISNSPDGIAEAEEAGYLYVLGDATSDGVLRKAGVKNARGLVAALDSDADNTYITLSARQLRPDLFIETRASGEEAGAKMKQAGANRIISPHSIGARRMAMIALRPAVVDFIDTVTYRHGRELQLENIAVGDASPLVGLNIEAARQRTKAAILAISKQGDKLVANPSGEETIEAGDILITIGTRGQLASLETICERCEV